MPTRGKLELRGLEEYLEALAQAEKDVDAAARDVLFDAALSVQEEMQEHVPVLTGRLFQHIQIDGPHTDGNFSWCEVGIIHNLAFTPK